MARGAVNKSVDQLKATGLSLQQQAEETVEQLKVTAEQVKEAVDSWMQEKGYAKIEEIGEMIGPEPLILLDQTRTKMPGVIKTEPNAKLIFNAPFAEKNRYNLTITNLGALRMGWAIKTTNMKRLAVDPPAGVLDPKEQQSLFVSCEPFSYETEDTNNDRITFEWTNAAEGAAKQFRREWFQGDRMIRRKNIPIQYNP